MVGHDEAQAIATTFALTLTDPISLPMLGIIWGINKCTTHEGHRHFGHSHRFFHRHHHFHSLDNYTFVYNKAY